MPAYNRSDFDPPAPFALVELRNPASGATLPGVPMLIDTGADVTLVPQGALDQLSILPALETLYELAGFAGGTRTLAAVRLELIFYRKTFRGQFLPVDQPWGILGRNVLNALVLLLNGPSLTWEEHKA